MAGTGNKIIKKVKKGGHAAHHGGSWKVAYADFVTAMMAFFLLMWLLSALKPQQKQALGTYFREFSIWESGGMIGAGESGDGALKRITEQPDANNIVEEQKKEDEANAAALEQLKTDLPKIIEDKLKDMKDQVVVDTFEGGVRIQIMDKQDRPLFQAGRAVPTETAKAAFKTIAETLNTVDNKLAVEGHTDAHSYASSKYTNWELSTDRASAARKELELSGISPDRLMRISGYAATDPLIKNDPYDPRNRRISVLIFSKPGERRQGVGIGPSASPNSTNKSITTDDLVEKIQRDRAKGVNTDSPAKKPSVP